MKSPYQTIRRVEFRDTDAAGMVHFSVFFTYMEQAEHALLRELGLSVVMTVGGQTISWPRVSAQCDYRSPARFEDELVIVVRVARIGDKSVTYGFEFHREDTLLAVGTLVAACCRLDVEQPYAVTIPPEIISKLREATDE